jgi:hypothetical protein
MNFLAPLEAEEEDNEQSKEKIIIINTIVTKQN